MVKIKILHIWNPAGVASIIAKYMDKLYNTQSLVIHRRAFDPYGVTTYGELWDCGAKEFTVRALLKARGFDIVHVHYFHKIIPFLRRLYSIKPIVMHFHGDDIRNKWKLMQEYWEKADLIFYSTLDLKDEETPEKAIYMPNPVDTDIFHSLGVRPAPKTAFHVSYNADDLAEKLANKYSLKLTIHDQDRQGVIPHLELPKILSQYEYYIDVKRNEKESRYAIPFKSKLALEALACKLKVISWDGKIVEELPGEHKPESVTKEIYNAYQKIVTKNF